MRLPLARLSHFALALCVVCAIPASAEPLPVKTVEFRGESVGRTLKYNICLPAGYETSTERYPVLYLLHGFSSNYTAWERLGVPFYAQFYQMIVVMPDGGNSWYVNWARSDGGQKNAWEDFMVKDLIGHVDSNFRTIAKREGRAINGLSMGGYGGMVLGLRHPDLFCSIGSESGALAFAATAKEAVQRAKEDKDDDATPPRSDAPNPVIGIPGFSSQRERTPKGRIFSTAQQCDDYDPFEIVKKIPVERLPHIYLDCGTEDGLIETAHDFAKLLMKLNIPFTYAQSEGEHRPQYWSREVGQAMAVQWQIMERNLGKQRIRLRQTGPPGTRSEAGGRGEPPAKTEEKTSMESVPGTWPSYSGELSGENEIRFKNANEFPMKVGLRSGGKGLDFIVPGKGGYKARVPSGVFEMYFQTPGDNGSFFQGKSLTLEKGGVDIEIGQVPSGR